MPYPDMNNLESVSLWADEYIKSHPEPDFHIGPVDNQQLQRWFIVPRNKIANVYLHRFLRSDDDRALHDHPWNNISWILSGTYIEHIPYHSFTRFSGGRVERKADMPHRIELIDGPVTTLFFTGPVIREWGFHCPQGWRHWKEFVSMVDGGNTIGKGCE